MLDLAAALGLARALGRNAAELAQNGRARAYARELAGSYAFTRLNLFFCLKGLGEGELRRVAREVMLNRFRNDLDFESSSWAPLADVGFDRLRRALAPGRGAVVCTQHVGPYRRLFFELLRRDLHVNLLVARHVVGPIRAQARRRLGSADAGGRLNVVDAHQPGSARELLQALRRNEVVLLYLDGNTGVAGPGGEGAAPANAVVVDFFGRATAVRSGACQLAHASGAPIVPLFARWRPDFGGAMEFLEPSAPDRTAASRDYCRGEMQRLFSLCEAAIRERPAQFEEWPSVHRWWVRGPAGPPVRAAAPNVPAPSPASTLPNVPAAPASPNAPTAPSAADRARRFLPDAGGALLFVDARRALALSVGGKTVLADGPRGRLLETDPLVRDVVAALRRPSSAAALHRRLGRKHPSARIAAAAARLAALGLLEEVSL